MKYIVLDSETNDHLDTFFELRNWSNVIKRVFPIGTDTEIIWVKRTPEEKGENPFLIKQELLEKMPMEDYIRLKKNNISKGWKDAIIKGENPEYYKGQFIVLRELLEPKYRRNEP